MNRIKSLAVAVVASTAVASGLMAAAGGNAGTQSTVEKFDIDSGHSSVLFKASHMGIANFYGRFNTVSGTVDLDGGVLDVTIDVNSVDSNSDGRDKHLKSADFFNAGQFPEATFKATNVEADGDEYAVTGDMTIRGETKEVSFTFVKTGEGDRGERFGYRAGWETELVINRMDYGIAYMPDGLGKDVTLIISLEGVMK